MNAIMNYITFNTKPLETINYNINNELWQLNIYDEKNADMINKRVEILKNYSNAKEILNL